MRRDARKVLRRCVLEQHRQLLRRRDVHAAANLPYADDEAANPVDFALGLRIARKFLRLWDTAGASRLARAARQAAPRVARFLP